MKDFALVLVSTAATIACWGLYGPLIRRGTGAMHHNHWIPFICVGAAYFVMAVAIPAVLLKTRGEKGAWTVSGFVWSLAGGALGAVGALGVILAFVNHGSPLYVMPLVFGGAPVVNTVYTMYISRTYKEAGPLFYAGLILVIAGAVTVLLFNPAKSAAPGSAEHANLLLVLAFVALTQLCWGVYGPIVHRGQAAMQGSRLRPFICVGLAYFAIAVVVPSIWLGIHAEPVETTVAGLLWSLGGGAAGAAGALGIIMAFNFGGKPVYVMPLVFGGAPVVNTFVSILMQGASEISVMFYAGLLIVVAGAATVLVFAPKGHAPAPVGKAA